MVYIDLYRNFDQRKELGTKFCSKLIDAYSITLEFGRRVHKAVRHRLGHISVLIIGSKSLRIIMSLLVFIFLARAIICCDFDIFIMIGIRSRKCAFDTRARALMFSYALIHIYHKCIARTRISISCRAKSGSARHDWTSGSHF